MPRNARFYHRLEEDFSVYSDAPLALRVFAFVTDFTVIGSIASLLNSFFLLIAGDLAKELADTYWFWWISILICLVIPTWKWQLTLGKYIVGLRVVSHKNANQKLSFTLVLGREISKLILLASLVMVLYILFKKSQKNPRLVNDSAFGARVISLRETNSSNSEMVTYL